ncbi:MAG: FAD-dependent oxidoreductase, partial [Holophagales bacterium]|nr:FAD-dependent oxidoreductase [Holophagales bacterium]
MNELKSGGPSAAPGAGAPEVGPPAETLDLLIVGGGPAGVAAALRARELGLSAVLIEVDDVLRRIRDYSKDKLILPGFGGGDTMAFPEGGEWIGRLTFDPIDKDEMCARWKGLCRDAGVPVQVATELVGLDELEPAPGEEAEGAGEPAVHLARVYDHRERREGSYRVRHVALALGRGVPRRFDIPGDTSSIPLRLEDPAALVGQPACVIGGGTSAAEAVIAISNAKAAAGDTSPVIWSYRGDRLPRVSKALAEVFFQAYAGNGNIRYHPSSEPMMVCDGADRRPYLALRIDRRELRGRPVETTLLELPTEACIACIGEDLPEAFLGSVGIVMVQAGAGGRKRMVVNRFLESRRPRVYLIGDILSQAYLEADDFDADPRSFRQIRHRGNIKSALADGVLVAEVVAQR